MLNVVAKADGRPKITGIMPLPKTSNIPDQFHESVVFSIDDYQKGDRAAFNLLADGIRAIILRSSELADSQDEGDDHNGEDIPDFSNDEDVPF